MAARRGGRHICASRETVVVVVGIFDAPPALGGDDIAFYVVVNSTAGLKCLVPRRQHYDDGNPVHFVTASTYHRARVFDSDRCKLKFVRALGDLRVELGFRIVGYVLMPEHYHVLIWPAEAATLSQIMQKLSERTANFVLRHLSRNRTRPWCERMLRRLELPATVHHHAHHRVWQRGGYDLNIWSEKKLQEKLVYMHNNPVKRGLAANSGDWPWSSWRFYYLRDSSILAMDKMP